MKRIRLIVVMLAALLSVGGLWMVMAQEAEVPAVLPDDPGDGDPEEATDIQIPEYVDATEYLRQATRAMAAKDYGRAFKAFREVLNRWPDLMFKRDTNLYYGIPRYARRMIMSIPPENLGELGIEEEATARRLLGRARETFDLEPLRTIRDKYFWTRSGAQALELLGDIQLERDHVAEAIHSYYQLLQEYRLEKDQRVRVTRKLVVALSDKGDQLFLLKVLKDLVPIAPEVELSDGTSLVEARAFLERLSSTTETMIAGDPDGWSEFGGDVSRTGWAREAVETDVRKWNRTITPLGAKRARSLNTGPGGAPINIRPVPVPRGMPQLPQPVSGVTGGEFQNYAVVAEGRVMYVEHDRIVALDIDTGNLLWEVGNPFAREAPRQVDPRRNMYNRGQGQPRPSHTLTVRGKVLYALRPDGDRFEVLMIDILTGKRLGKVPSRSFQPAFLGAGSIASGIMPYGGRVYIGYSSSQNGGARSHYNPGFMNEHFVAIDMQDPRNPVLLWDTMLYGTSLSRYHINAGGRFDAVHLPTVGGNALYYNSDDGALVSLDTMTGEIRFIYTYEKFVPVRSYGRNPKPTRQPPPPCYTAAPLYYNGTVFCAPSEAWDYFALDGATGELKWFYPRKELNFVVGVRKGIVYLTGARIEARHIETGKLAWETSLSGMKPGGKGTLVGNMLYVPMREESPRGNRDRILRFDAETGKRLEPINLDAKEHELGNLVMAGKTLLSLNAYRISAFTAWDHQYNLLMARLKDDPNHSPTLFHLGSMYARRQSYERAIDIYKQALQHVAAEQDYQGQPLGDVLKDRLYDFYRDKTRKEFEDKQYDTALATAGETLQYAVTPEQTVETRFTRAMLQEQLTHYDRAALEYQQVKKRHPRVTYQDKQDSEIAAGVYATVEIDRLVKQHGQEAYALVEEEARRLVESDKVEDWELVVVEFGPARARREALLKLADHYIANNDPKRGARYLKRFVARYPDDNRAPQKAVAAVETFEKLESYYDAGSLLKRMARDLGTSSARVGDKVVKLGEYAQQKLAMEVYQQVFALPGGRIFALDLPLAEAWDTGKQQNMNKYSTTQPFELDGQSMVATLMYNPNRIIARNVTTGKLKWERAFVNRGVNYFRFAPDGQHMIMLDGAGNVECIDTRTGKLVWKPGTHIRKLKLQGGARVVNQNPSGVAVGEEVVALSYRVQKNAGGRVRGYSSCIVAYRRDTGKLAWVGFADGNQYGYAYREGQDSLVLVDGKLVTATTRHGNSKGGLYVFDMASGKLKATHAFEGYGARQIVKLDDQRVMLAVQGNRGYEIQMYDVSEDKILWASQTKLPHGGNASKLFAVGEQVLFSSYNGVHAFNMDTGKTSWFKTNYQNQQFRVHDVIADPAGVYVMYHHQQNEFDNRIDKLALEGGKLMWSQKLPQSTIGTILAQSQDYLVFPIVAGKPRNNQGQFRVWNAVFGQATLMVLDKDSGNTALKMNIGKYIQGNPPRFNNPTSTLDITMAENAVFIELQGKLISYRSRR